MLWKRWSGCTAGKTIRKKKDRRGRHVPTVKGFRIMQNKEVGSVHLWKKKRSVRTVRYIVISRKWENRFDRSCVFQDQGCYYTIHFLQYGIWYAVNKINGAAKRLLSNYWSSYTELGDSFLENLQGLTTLKIYQADQQKADEMDVESQNFRRIMMKVRWDSRES